MNVVISNASKFPIYDQIFQQIKVQILDGSLQENDALPSMRVLAKDLRISVITTKRAYEELEKANFIYSITGKGSFVAKRNIELIKEENLRLIEEKISELMDLFAQSNIDINELHEMIDTIKEIGNE